MKRKSLIFIILITVLISVSFLLFFGFLRNSKNTVAKATEYSYIIKEYDGKIGVYKAEEKNPFQVIDVPVYHLPPYDKSELELGILIKDEKELQQKLEDYAS